jgi:PAS domain S-box-containing protein
MRLYWIFVAMTGSYFSRHRYLTLFLGASFVITGAVHLALPQENLPYSIKSYFLLTPPLLLSYFYVVSQSIFTRRCLEESQKVLLDKTIELDSILNSLSAMVIYKDTNNNLLNVNQSFADCMNMTREELIGKSMSEVLSPELGDQCYLGDQEVMRTGKAVVQTVEKISTINKERMCLRTSRIPIRNEKGEINRIVVSLEDVTEQTQYEERLRESEERFRMIFDFAPDGIALVDHESARFLKLNAALVKMLGYEEQEYLNKTTMQITHPDDRWITPAKIKEMEESGSSYYELEKRYIRKNGSVIYCFLSVYIIRKDGKPQYRVGIWKDVTQKKENELRLQRYARQLEESNQNLQEFAYAASHDLKEPLRTVVSYVQLLNRYLPSNQITPEISEFMGYIISGAKRMETQISALLDYSRVGKGELMLKKVDLYEALISVCAALRIQLAENQAVIETNELPVIIADRYQIEALFQNLLSNAIKYRKTDESPLIRIEAKIVGKEFVVSVTDNGMGIESDYLEKIFAVFRRLHRNEQIPGNGVGLAICRRIVQRHGGKIWADSEYGVGTTFYFTLPIIGANNDYPAIADPLQAYTN